MVVFCRSQPIQFMWVDGRKQPTFTSAFLSTGAALPSAILFSPRKQRFSQLRGSFTHESLSLFIDKLLSAQIATSPLTEMPSLVLGGEAGLGQEEEPLLEEEFDLSEVMAVSISEGDGDRGEKLRVVCLAPPFFCSYPIAGLLATGSPYF
jgi:hypothetical protein